MKQQVVALGEAQGTLQKGVDGISSQLAALLEHLTAPATPVAAAPEAPVNG